MGIYSNMQMQITSWTEEFPPLVDGYGKTIGHFNQIPPAGWVRLFDEYWITEGDDIDYISHLPRISHNTLVVWVPYGSGSYLSDIENVVAQINSEYYT